MRKLFKPILLISALVAVNMNANTLDAQIDAEIDNISNTIKDGEINLSESQIEAFLITGLGTLVKDIGGQLIKAVLSKGKEEGKVQVPSVFPTSESPEETAPAEAPSEK